MIQAKKRTNTLHRGGKKSRPVNRRTNKYRTNASPGGLRRAGAGFFATFRRTAKVVFSGVFLVCFLAVLSLGLILGYHYMMNSPYFHVRKVVLTGVEKTDRETLVRNAGLDRPVNLLSLKLDEMGRAMRSLPWVDQVTLTRKPPDTLIVEVEEHRARALISLGALYYLDDNGRPFKKVDPRENPDLPIVTGFSREDLAARPEMVRGDVAEVFRLLDVLAERNDRFRLSNVSEVNFDPVRGLSIFTRENHVQVKVGLGDYDVKFRRLGRVLAHLKIQGRSDALTYFNVEHSPRVVVRSAANS